MGLPIASFNINGYGLSCNRMERAKREREIAKRRGICLFWTYLCIYSLTHLGDVVADAILRMSPPCSSWIKLEANSGCEPNPGTIRNSLSRHEIFRGS